MVSDLLCPICRKGVHPMHWETHLAKCDIDKPSEEVDWEYAAKVLHEKLKEFMVSAPEMKREGQDGTEKLCMVLYGEVAARYYIGGSQAKMLHDAVARIQEEENRSDLFSKIVTDVANALGQKFGETTHDLGNKVRMIRERVSGTDVCHCPEFCSYHARANFEKMRDRIKDLEDFVSTIAEGECDGLSHEDGTVCLPCAALGLLKAGEVNDQGTD